MKRILLAGLCLIGFAGLAQAADLAVKAPARAAPAAAPVASWTGFYLGIGLGTRTWEADGNVVSGTNNGVPLVNAGGFGCNTPGPGCAGSSIDGTAFRVSGYLGYNYQIAPQWLVGIEGDFGWAERTRTVSGELLPGGGVPFFMTGRADDSFGIRTRWDASARARLGWIVTPDFLIYATGGAAWQQFEAISTCGSSVSCTPTGFGPNVITDSRTRLGWTAGGGLETLLWGSWIARAEYRFADFGTVTNTDIRVCACGGTVTQVEMSSVRLFTHTVTFGIAYKFGYGAPAVAARY